MRPIDFPGSDAILGAPDGWDAATHGPCDGLPVLREGGACISLWQPTAAERSAISAGANIRLSVYSGRTQPPVMLTTGPAPKPEQFGEPFQVALWGDGTPAGTRLADLRCGRHLRSVTRLTLHAGTSHLVTAHLVVIAGTDLHGPAADEAELRHALRCWAVIVSEEEA